MYSKAVEGRHERDLTAFKKKGLDRKTNHHDLTKIETKEIFVLTKAIGEKETVALKLGQIVKEGVEVAKAVEAQEKAEALPRRANPPPWRDKLQSNRGCCRTEEAARQEVEKKRTAETEVQCCGLQAKKGHEGCRPFFVPSQQFLVGGTETKAHSEKSMNVSDVKVTDQDGYVSRSKTIKANNKIVKANLDHCEVDNSESCGEGCR